jgi:hypothetical protein
MAAGQVTGVMVLTAAGLSVPGIAGAIASDAPTGWLCVAEKATGFAYDKQKKAWTIAEFDADRKFLVRQPNTDELSLFRKLNGDDSKPPSYVVRIIGDTILPPMPCGEPSFEIRTIKCDWYQVQFIINPDTLRMEWYSSYGYIDQFSSLLSGG